MNTTHSETEEILKAALSYYNAMCTKDFDTMANFLSEGVCLISPLAKIDGKEEVLTAAKNFGGMLKNIQIRASFAPCVSIVVASTSNLTGAKGATTNGTIIIRNKRSDRATGTHSRQ